MNPVEIALAYAARQWFVFPCREVRCGAKHKAPWTKNGHLDASTDPEQIRKWWKQKPQALIGIDCGRSGLVVVDVDSADGHGGPDGYETWSEHKIEAPEVENTMLVETFSGGLHAYFSANGHKVQCDNTGERLGPGIHVKAQGGYVIAGGSEGYEFVEGHGLERLAGLPAYLSARLAYVSRAPLIPAEALTIPQGSRNAALTSLAGTMRKRGMSEDAILAALLAENKEKCKPEPLPEAEVAAIAKSVSRYAPAEVAAVAKGNGKPEPLTCLPAVSFGSLLDSTPERPEYVWYGYLAKGAVTELAAKPKVGKTRLALEIVRCVLAGEEMLGHATFRCPVLYMTEQGHGSFITQTRASHLHDSRDGFHVLLRGPVRRLGWAEVGELAVAYVKEHGIGLVVIDTLSEWASIRGDDENSAGAAMAAMAPLNAIATTGAAVLAVRHERKGSGDVGESARGSSAFGGGMDILMALRRTRGHGHETRRELYAVGRFDDAPPVLTMEYDLETHSYSLVMAGADVRKREVELNILEILPQLQGWALSVAEICEQLDVPDKTARRALKDLTVSGVIKQGTQPREDGFGRLNVYWHESASE